MPAKVVGLQGGEERRRYKTVLAFFSLLVPEVFLILWPDVRLRIKTCTEIHFFNPKIRSIFIKKFYHP